MTIKATVKEVLEANRALRRINEEVRLPQKAAWRVARLLGQFKPVVVDFEMTQLKLYRDAGGVERGNGVEIAAVERGEDEPQADWLQRRAEHDDAVNGLGEQIRALQANEIDINYDPLPLSLFADEDSKTKKLYSANDFADAGPFIAED